MALPSILFVHSNPSRALVECDPKTLSDLGLKDVFAQIGATCPDRDIAPILRRMLSGKEALHARQAVFKALRDKNLVVALEGFAAQMRALREARTAGEKVTHPLQRQLNALALTRTYINALKDLGAAFGRTKAGAQLLDAFGAALNARLAGPEFTKLDAHTSQLSARLHKLRYALSVKNDVISVTALQKRGDLSARTRTLLKRFSKDIEDLPSKVVGFASGNLNHIEEAILERVAFLFVSEFSDLHAFFQDATGVPDQDVDRFDTELAFYLAVNRHFVDLEQSGLPVCLPQLSETEKPPNISAGYDLALAARLQDAGHNMVPNDVPQDLGAHIIVVTGPNQGGKTTFARMIGQTHFLAALGAPVPARKATLFVPDRIFTHFERREDAAQQQGRLLEAVTRIHDILRASTDKSLIVMNEVFNSTSLADAVLLSGAVLKKIKAKQAICVWVTFLDELANSGPAVASMVAQLEPGEGDARSFRVAHQPADGRAHAMAIAAKYGLTYEAIKARLRK